MREMGANKSRLFGYSGYAPEDPNFKTDGLNFFDGDILLNSKSSALNNAIGWRCITAGTPGTWETIHYFKPAEPSPNTAINPGATYSQAEVQGILNELRDLKTVLRTAGILKT